LAITSTVLVADLVGAKLAGNLALLSTAVGERGVWLGAAAPARPRQVPISRRSPQLAPA
jgi:hypothetical protein